MKNENITNLEYLKTEDYIRFTEFPLAISIICCMGLSPVFNRDPKSTQIEFIFPKEASKIIDAYWNGGLLIEPKQFWQVSRELKARMRMESSEINYETERKEKGEQ